MERIDALKALLAKVDGAGDWLGLMEDTLSYETWDIFIGAYNGSLDAAKAMHDAVLPGWGFEVCEFAADVTNRHTDDGLDGYKWFNSNCDNPARAWLIAILKALISEEELDDKRKQ